jgi:hypothetical protein
MKVWGGGGWFSMLHVLHVWLGLAAKQEDSRFGMEGGVCKRSV